MASQAQRRWNRVTDNQAIRVVVGPHDPIEEQAWAAFRRLVADQWATKELIKEAEKEVKGRQVDIDAAIFRWADAHPQATHFLLDLKGVAGVVQFHRVYPSPRREVSVEKLLELGVSPVVIGQATIEKPVAGYTRMELIKEEEATRLKLEGRI